MSDGPFLRVRNWERFQHYKTRRPPWIKLHVSLLDDPEIVRLSDSDFAALVRLWITASKTGNRIPDDVDYLSKVARVDGQTKGRLIRKGFILKEKPPNHAGFLPVVLATRKQSRQLEKEREAEIEEAKQSTLVENGRVVDLDAVLRSMP